MDIIELLEYLEEIVETGSKIPMTGKVIIDKKEALDTIQSVINSLPDEFKKSKWVLTEKERILSEAIKDAEIMRRENKDMLKKQIEGHDVTKEAQLRADHILSLAQKDAKEMRLGARDYANDVLNQLDDSVNTKYKEMAQSLKKDFEQFMISMQNDVNSTTGTVRENINELKNIK